MKLFFYKIFIQPTNNTAIQFVRYLFVGGTAFVADFVFLYIFTSFLGLNYLVSATLSFIIGLMINYLLSIVWVFNKHVMGNRWAELTLFLIIGVVGLGLNDTIMWASTSIFGIFYLFSKIIATVIVYFWNFFARKFLIFNRTLE